MAYPIDYPHHFRVTISKTLANGATVELEATTHTDKADIVVDCVLEQFNKAVADQNPKTQAGPEAVINYGALSTIFGQASKDEAGQGYSVDSVELQGYPDYDDDERLIQFVRDIVRDELANTAIHKITKYGEDKDTDFYLLPPSEDDDDDCEF